MMVQTIVKNNPKSLKKSIHQTTHILLVAESMHGECQQAVKIAEG
jgi:hypothetical protein